MKIYLDFDGTVCVHRYPQIGAENPGWKQVVEQLLQKGHEVVLNTYRADLEQADTLFLTEIPCQENYFELAKRWIAERGVFIQALDKKVNPLDWHRSLRGGKVFIDDHAEDIPLMILQGCKVVDWQSVQEDLQRFGIL